MFLNLIYLLSTKMNRGAFILFEGIDRCGKTTQVSLLQSKLEAKGKSEMIRFPNRSSTIGQLINTYLTSSSNEMNDNTIHLLFSANRWEQSEAIKKQLLEGCTLVCGVIFIMVLNSAYILDLRSLCI